MEPYAWFLIPAVVVLGIITSYTDIRYGKIKNKWILTFLLYGVIVYLGYFIYTLNTNVSPMLLVRVGEEQIKYSLFTQVISNFILSLGCGVLIWSFNLWSAADAKLFAVFSFLVPMYVYETDFIRYFPGVVIAINSITLIVFFIFMQVLHKNYQKVKESLKETLTNPKELFDDIQMLFLVQGIMSLVFTFLNKEELTIFFALGAYSMMRYFITHLSVIMDKFRYIIILGIIARAMLDFEYIFTLEFLINFLIMVLFFVIIKNVFIKIADKTFYSRVPISRLKSGMIWDKYLIDTGKEIKPWENYRTIKGGKILVEPSVEGLTEEDVKIIKDAYKNNKLTFNCLDVSTRTYFAPFLSAATIITMVIGGALLTYLFPFLS